MSSASDDPGQNRLGLEGLRLEVPGRGGREQVATHLLFPVLLGAFAVAAVATLAGARNTVPAAVRPSPTTEPAAHARLSATRDQMVPVQVADLLSPDGDGSPVVLLMDNASHFVLPVLVDSEGSESIRRGLAGAREDGLHGLLSRTVVALGGEIDRIEVREPAGDQEAARVVVLREGTEMVIDASLGDGIALALTTGTPLYVAGKVLATQGIKREDIKKPRGGLPSNLRMPERL